MPKSKKLIMRYILLLTIGCSLLFLVACDKEAENTGQVPVKEASGAVQDNTTGNLPQQQEDSIEVGLAPNRESNFGKLDEDEQSALVHWFEAVAGSYSKISKGFEAFKSEYSVDDALVSETEAFRTLKSTCEGEINKLNGFATDKLPESSRTLVDQSSDINKWCINFLNAIGDKKGTDPDIEKIINDSLGEAMQKMQAFIDSVAEFTS